MKTADIKSLSNAAKKGGLDAAIAVYLDLTVEFKAAGNKVPPGCEASFGAIRAEVEQYNGADKETQQGIDQFKELTGQA